LLNTGYDEGVAPVEVKLSAPTCLIAVPQLGDPNFARTVVLILEHGEQGSMGLVINRPTNLETGLFCDEQGFAFAGDPALPVHFGGPVQTDRAFVLHSAEFQGPETDPILEDVSLSYSVESLGGLAATPPTWMRIFMGYAGWGPGQLADEISDGAWLLVEPSANLVFAVPAEEVWEAALRQLGIEPLQLMYSNAVH